jgi:hypothetical protein
MTRTSSWRTLALLLCAPLLGFGCTNRVADLTLISTKNIDLSNARLDVRDGQRVEGKHCVYALLGLLPLGVVNLEEAIDDALERGGGNILVDQVTYQSIIYFVLASQECLTVEGTVLQTARRSALPEPARRVQMR